MRKSNGLWVFNCSTNIVGGAVQNSVNFIKNIRDSANLEYWHFILSYPVY